MDVLVGAGALGVAHIAGDGAVFQSDGVLALNDQRLGVVGGEGGVLHGDVGSGVDSGRVIAVGGVAAAAYVHGAAAPIGTDGRRGIAGGVHGEVAGVGGAAAGGLEAAGVVGGGGDGGIGDIHGGAAAVAEHAVAVLGGGGDGGVLDGHGGAARGQKRGIDAVEVAVFRVGGGAAGLIHGDAVQSHRGAVHAQGVFIVAGGGVGFLAVSAVFADGVGAGALGDGAAAAEAALAADHHGCGYALFVKGHLHHIARRQVGGGSRFAVFRNGGLGNIHGHGLTALGEAALLAAAIGHFRRGAALLIAVAVGLLGGCAGGLLAAVAVRLGRRLLAAALAVVVGAVRLLRRHAGGLAVCLAAAIGHFRRLLSVSAGGCARAGRLAQCQGDGGAVDGGHLAGDGLPRILCVPFCAAGCQS